MRRLKKVVMFLLISVLVVAQIVPVYAKENELEWYDMVEEDFEIMENIDTGIQPYTMYIMDVITSVAKISSNKLGIRADVICSSTMSNITVTIYLQKSTGSSWVNVASKTLSSTNVSSTIKKVTVSGLSSGTYRAKVAAKVTDKYGYAESITGYSGALSI